MFKVKKTREAWWPVTIKEPVDDPARAGTVHSVECQLHFVLMTQQEIQALEGMKEDDARQTVAEKIIGWTDIEDDDGPLGFGAENRDALMRDDLFAKAVVFALIQASAGVPVKNS